MLINQIKLQNVLSFGPDAQELELKPLNVLIGPNGSGKSNLIEAIGLLRAAASDLTKPIVDGGGVSNWIWKGEPEVSSACIEVVLANTKRPQALRHSLTFAERGQRFELTHEKIENEEAYAGHAQPYIYFDLQHGRATLNFKDETNRQLQREDLDPEQSVLTQRRDPDHYPELTWLGDTYRRIRLYREWSFGRNTPPRIPQDAALPNDFLIEGGQNLGLMLNRLKSEPKAKSKFMNALRQLYEDVNDFDVVIEGGTVQVILQERNIIVPSIRLSDGTLRYLSLLAILCHPKPPPFICLEEPELGLHPDILPGLAELLRDASDRCQLIVTTHSDVLVDALTDTPESIVVCEKHDGQTKIKRLDKANMEHWLEKYRLGELWTSGELGGNRW
ncbi:MAG: AAA family ATPase [Gammaproteobacteria bacterium]|nr:AAA family ATPase [Gammaproteobacteria bacterium]MCY4339956.1 AAA family ATPase [Gammaproteobacteria bacterium]